MATAAAAPAATLLQLRKMSCVSSCATAAPPARLASRPSKVLRHKSKKKDGTGSTLLDHADIVPGSDAAALSDACALRCPHFDSCSGCSHEWNLDKPQILQEVRKFFKDNGVAEITFDSGKLLEWRCRAKLAVRGTPENPLVGLYQEGTHTVVDIPQCRAHHPSINAAVDLLKEGISKLNIQPFDEDSGAGELRYVQMAVTTYSSSLPQTERYQKGRVQVSLVWNSRDGHSHNSEKLSSLSDFIWRNGGPSSGLHLVHSVWANFQTSNTNIIFGNKWRHLRGERDFWEHIGGVDVSFDPSCFVQANTSAFSSLLRKLQKNIPCGSSVVDLYSGAGVIGLSVAVTRKCRSVKCVEVSKEPKTSFEKSTSRLPGDLGCMITWHNADASTEPIHWLAGADVVIVDPPRKGLHQSLLDALHKVASFRQKINIAPESPAMKARDEKRPWILRARQAAASVNIDGAVDCEHDDTRWPTILIYISCGWESFKEDCKNLTSNKAWHLDKAHAFNFFPGTQSIEVLAVFKWGPRVSSQASTKKAKRKIKKKASH